MPRIVSDACRGLVEAAADLFRERQVAEVALMLKAIHAQEDRDVAPAKATEVVARLKELKLCSAADPVEQKVGETLLSTASLDPLAADSYESSARADDS